MRTISQDQAVDPTRVEVALHRMGMPVERLIMSAAVVMVVLVFVTITNAQREITLPSVQTVVAVEGTLKVPTQGREIVWMNAKRKDGLGEDVTLAAPVLTVYLEEGEKIIRIV